jgi:holo-[acyl-carrier protein] synthase
MIFGLGIDLVDIAKFSKSLEAPNFKQKIFSLEERTLSPIHLAGRFAAREAFFKALDDQELFNYRDLEVMKEINGKPRFKFVNELAKYCEDKSVHLSISHTSKYAIAIVIIESKLPRNLLHPFL